MLLWDVAGCINNPWSGLWMEVGPRPLWYRDIDKTGTERKRSLSIKGGCITQRRGRWYRWCGPRQDFTPPQCTTRRATVVLFLGKGLEFSPIKSSLPSFFFTTSLSVLCPLVCEAFVSSSSLLFGDKQNGTNIAPAFIYIILFHYLFVFVLY